MVRSLGFWPADAGDDLRIETLYTDLTSIYTKIMTFSIGIQRGTTVYKATSVLLAR